MAAANPPAMTADRRLAVRFDAGISPQARRTPPPVCVVGIVPPDAPWLADHYPHSVIRDTRFRDPDFSVEHVRLSTRASFSGLPCLTDKYPSRVRDAVVLARQAGLEEVDVVLARVNGAKPWEFDRPELLEALDPFLGDMLTSVLVFPDLGGPVPVLPGKHYATEEQVQRMLDAVKIHAPLWTQRYQVAMLDAPLMDRNLEERLFRGLSGTDAALCRWDHSDHWGPIHGWRSAAAVIAGMSVTGNGFGSGLEGRKIRMPAGRRANHGRFSSLSLSERRFPPPSKSEEYASIQVRRGVATLLGEPTFRQPIGAWTIAALRTVKIIHWRMVETASQFVFDKVHEAQAAALADGMTRSLRPFTARGLLVGGDGIGEPEIRGGLDRNPAAPSLFADITATLQPWSHRVVVRVGMRPGTGPYMEVK